MTGVRKRYGTDLGVMLGMVLVLALVFGISDIAGGIRLTPAT